MRIIRYMAATALALSGVALAWRALIGPFRLLALSVNSPLNAQSIFGLSTTALLLLNAGARRQREERDVRHASLWLLAILLMTAAVFWQSLRFPLVFDDYTLVRQAREWGVGSARYLLTQGGGDGFFRPLGYMSLHLDALWAGLDPLRWHLTGFALHLANTVLLWLVAVHLLRDRAASLWAAALFAVHGAALQTAGYLATRFDALATFFVLAGLVLLARYLERGERLSLSGSLGCAFLALLTKETAFCFPLLAALVCGGQAWQRRRVLTGYVILAAAVFGYRYSLFGGIGGYRDAATRTPAILQTPLLDYVKGLALRIWSAFYFPVNWSRQPEPWLAMLLLAYLAVLAWMTLRTETARQDLRLAVAFAGAALLPVAHLLLVDASLLGAWRFYLATGGFAMFLGAAVRGMGPRLAPWAGAALILFQLAALQHNLRLWGETAALAARTCATAAEISGRSPGGLSVSGLPRQIDGVPFLGQGFEACVALSGASPATPGAAPQQLHWDGLTRQLVSN